MTAFFCRASSIAKGTRLGRDPRSEFAQVPSMCAHLRGGELYVILPGVSFEFPKGAKEKSR